MSDPRLMRWPTLWHKLRPISVFRWPAYAGWWVWYRNWYYGPWLQISLGWWCVQIASGTYD